MHSWAVETEADANTEKHSNTIFTILMFLHSSRKQCIILYSTNGERHSERRETHATQTARIVVE